jgi:hypothetical protein
MILDRMRTFTVIGALVALVLLIAACSPVAPETSAPSFDVATSAAAESIQPNNRLLVQGIDGNIYTLDPSGANAIALTTDASATVQYSQPSWSPFAYQIAWTTVTVQDGQTQSALIVATGTGNSRTQFDVPFPPF